MRITNVKGQSVLPRFRVEVLEIWSPANGGESFTKVRPSKFFEDQDKFDTYLAWAEAELKAGQRIYVYTCKSLVDTISKGNK